MADERDEAILSRLDVMAEYQLLGVRFATDEPRSSGVIEAYAIDREERRPSAFVNVNTGRYGDSASGKNYSLWEFSSTFGNIGVRDWKEARDHYAKKVGVEYRKTGIGKGMSLPPPPGESSKEKSPQVKVDRKPPGTKKPRKGTDDPATQLEFFPWDAGHERLANMWCVKHKKGVSVEAIKLCGGQLAYYPCRVNKETKERIRGETKVIALPCYQSTVQAIPVAWVLWALNGSHLRVYRGKDRPADLVKMKSVGPTRGTMMGLAGLQAIQRSDPAIVAVIKTAGPSDMLAVISAQTHGMRLLFPVVTNASSETGDILASQVNLLRGRKVILSHDADDAGEAGIEKWAMALDNHCEVVQAVLPYTIEKKGGKDVRDFIVDRRGVARA